MSKVLILVPSPNVQGGISNYYKVIKPFFKGNVTYFVRGRRRRFKYLDKIILLFTYFIDYVRFPFVLFGKETLVLNTSLGIEGLIRDGIYIKIAKVLRKNIIVYFRGLDPKIQEIIETKYLDKFRTYFFPANTFIVLSSQFSDKVKEWGFKNKVIMETTVVDDNLLNLTIPDTKKSDTKNLLFLSRLEKYKGIFEAIETFIILQKKYNNLVFTIAGEGSVANEVQAYIKQRNLKNIELVGHVDGKDKAFYYRNADLFIFPSYSEGMPNTILEAMAFGLPIVTSDVGGIPDIFENEKMGYMTNSIKPEVLAEYCDNILSNEIKRQEISQYNVRSSKRYLASNVTKRLEDIFLHA